MVKDCDPTTGIPDSDEGYNDEYMVIFFVYIHKFYYLYFYF